jgi:ribosomal protein L7/L12
VAALKNELARAKENPQPRNVQSAMMELLTYAHAGNKIGCIKVLRQATGLGLKETKDLFETVVAPGIEIGTAKPPIPSF